MKKHFWVLTLGTAALLAACSKPNPTPREPIVGDWVFEKVIFNYLEHGVVTRSDTSLAWLQDCEKDDFIAYRSNGIGYFSNGANLCDSQTNAVDSFRYDLLASRSQLRMLLPHKTDTIPIKLLTDTLMIHSRALLYFGPEGHSYTDIYYRKIR